MKRILWKRCGWVVLAALVAAVAQPAAADVPGTITKTSGQQVAGGLSWKAGAKQYEVSQPGARQIVPLNQVASLQVTPPANLEQAINAVRQQGQNSGPAVDALAKIVDDYLMLQHDLPAMRWLAQAYLRRGEGKQALDRFNRVMENRTPLTVPADVARAYWDVLLEAERFTELREQLKVAVERGPRPLAAQAHLLRGEMNMRRKEFRDALVDGFLRTVVLYSDVRDVQPEALFKASKCFEELGETQNAEKMRRKLAQDYPDSPFSK